MFEDRYIHIQKERNLVPTLFDVISVINKEHKLTRDYVLKNGTKIDGVSARLFRVENQIDNLGTRFDTLETRFDVVENRFDNLESRVDNLEKNVKEIQSDVSILKSDVSELKTNVNKILEILQKK